MPLADLIFGGPCPPPPNLRVSKRSLRQCHLSTVVSNVFRTVPCGCQQNKPFQKIGMSVHKNRQCFDEPAKQTPSFENVAGVIHSESAYFPTFLVHIPAYFSANFGGLFTAHPPLDHISCVLCTVTGSHSHPRFLIQCRD